MAKPPSILLCLAALALSACGPEDGDEPLPTQTAAPILPDYPPVAEPASPPPSEATVPQPSETPEAGSTRPEAEPAADECGADKLDQYLNVLPTSEILAKIRLAVGHDRIRVIEPGDAVTMDFRPDRLNVETGDDGRIKLFRCG